MKDALNTRAQRFAALLVTCHKDVTPRPLPSGGKGHVIGGNEVMTSITKGGVADGTHTILINRSNKLSLRSETKERGSHKLKAEDVMIDCCISPYLNKVQASLTAQGEYL
ncbi:MAG: hypothetical protein HC883_03450 [Bdellovibrionaceae bacterium]|nr:hypothetical protein [Pseudobdellovibrionaceae bacterium]